MKFLFVTALFYLSCTTNAKNADHNVVTDIEKEGTELHTNMMSDEKEVVESDDVTIDNNELTAEQPVVINKPETVQIVKDKNSKEEQIGNIKNEIGEKEPDVVLATEKPISEKDETQEEVESVEEASFEQNPDDAEPEAKEEILIEENDVDEEIEIAPSLDHSEFDQLLQEYVSNTGYVNYAGLSQNRNRLMSYLEKASAQVPNSDWSRDESLAYWINVYNAYTIDLILSNYPVGSIIDLDNGNPWEIKRIVLANKKYSLNQIEHEIIRPQFKDARIHFAVNCAAMSCPKLHNRAMTASNLNTTLDQLTKEFVNNKGQNVISSKQAQLSKIFEWYALDFGNLSEFINQYATDKLDASAQISYREYDWKLNGK